MFKPTHPSVKFIISFMVMVCTLDSKPLWKNNLRKSDIKKDIKKRITIFELAINRNKQSICRLSCCFTLTKKRQTEQRNKKTKLLGK